MCTVGTVNTDELFKGKRDSKKKYAMLFGKDIAYLNKAVYALVEYGPADEIEPSEEDVWILSNGQKKAAAYGDDDDDTGDEGFDGPYSIFSGEFRLVRFDTGTDAEEPVNLGKLPEALEKAEGYTMAAYNGKKYLAEQIDSILKQTYTNRILFIRDDGSSDGTIELLWEYREQYPDRIILVDNYSNGKNGAKNNFAMILKYLKENLKLSWEHKNGNYYIVLKLDGERVTELNFGEGY